MITLGVTLGCPSGVGAEVVAKALPKLPARVKVVLFGAPSAWEAGCREAGVSIPTGAPGDEAARVRLVPACDASARFVAGRPDAAADAACGRSLEDAVAWMKAGRVDVVATAPARKQAFQALAGGPFPGHTEFFHHHLGTTPAPVMLFVAPGMRLALHTIHVPLSAVPSLVTKTLLLDSISMLVAGLRDDLGIPSPSVDVLGLNPHAGEHGLLGREELEEMEPALHALQAQGMRVSGPFPADGYFARYRSRPAPDAVLALFHDQGLAPFKLWERGRGCQMTLGLRVPRTSCDHGTAYDLAGTGKADHRSMLAAMRVGVDVAKRRQAAG